MNRRIIIFLIFCVLILGAVGGTLFFFAKKQNTPPPDTRPLTVQKVLDEPVISPVASLDNNSIWYFNKDGRLFKATTDGQSLSEFALPSLPTGQNPKLVIWPKTGNDFITVSNDGTKNYYDSVGKIFIKLAGNIQYLDWQPDGKKIAYIWKSNDGKSQQLLTSNADGTGYRLVANVFWPDLVVKVADDGKTALLYRGQVQPTNKIYAVSLDTGVVSTLIDSGQNTAAMWTPASDKFLYTQASGEVFMHTTSTNNSADLKISTTLDRITMNNSGQAYAAVAKDDNTGDKIVSIDLNSLKISDYFTPSEEIHVKNLFLVGSTVYYTDTRDSKLYSISK